MGHSQCELDQDLLEAHASSQWGREWGWEYHTDRCGDSAHVDGFTSGGCPPGRTVWQHSVNRSQCGCHAVGCSSVRTHILDTAECTWGWGTWRHTRRSSDIAITSSSGDSCGATDPCSLPLDFEHRPQSSGMSVNVNVLSTSQFHEVMYAFVNK
jgi:hypothetical protein